MDSETAAEEVFAAFVARVDAGESLDFESFCDAHPALQSELRELHSEWLRVQSVLGRFADSPSDSNEAPVERDSGDADAILERLKTARLDAGRIRVQAEIMRGGQGIILRVRDELLRRNMAMKTVRLPRDRGQRASASISATVGRFFEEAQVTAQLDHPGVVPVHDVGVGDGGDPFFTMKLVRGDDLRVVYQKVAEGEDDWTVVRVLGVLLKVCEAMAYAHAKRVIHRDLKPSNVMVGRFGEVYVMDWGLARVLDEPGETAAPKAALETVTLTRVRSDRKEHGSGTGDQAVTMEGDVLGTPAYMSPEQAHGHLDRLGPRADVYSVGAMLYHLLAGRMPYAEPGQELNAHEILALVREGPPPPVSKLAPRTPPELAAICAKAMAWRERERYESMADLADDLRSFLENRVVRAYESGALAELRKWALRNRSLAAALVVAVLTLAVSAVVLGMAADRAEREKLRAQAKEREVRQERDRSDGLRLALQGMRAIDKDPALGLLLGLESSRRLAGIEANRTLARALRNLREKKTLRTDGATVRVLRFDPAGEWLLVAGAGGVLELYDVDSGKRRFHVDSGGPPWIHAEWSSDGTRFLAVSGTGDVRVWALGEEPSLELRADCQVLGNTGMPVRPAAFAGEALVAMTRGGSLRATPLVGDATEIVFSGLDEVPLWIAVGPSARRVAVVDAEGRVRAWDVRDGELVLENDYSMPVTRVEFLDSDDAVFAFHVEGVDRIEIDGLTERVLSRRMTHPAVHLSRDRRFLFQPDRSEPEIVDLLDGSRFELDLTAAVLEEDVEIAGFAPDARTLYLASGRRGAVLALDTRSGEVGDVLLGHAQPVSQIAASPRSGVVATTSTDGSVRLWSLSPENQGLRCDPGWRIESFTAGENAIALVEARVPEQEREDVPDLMEYGLAHVQVWREAPAFGRCIHRVSEDGTVAFAVSRSGGRVAIAREHGSLSEWDLAAGLERRLAEGLADEIADGVSFAYAAGDRFLAVGTLGGLVVLLDPASGEIIDQSDLSGAIEGLACEGDVLLAWSANEAVAWTVGEGDLAGEVAYESPLGEIRVARLSPGGARLFVALDDGTARVLSLEQTDTIEFQIPARRVFDAVWSADGGLVYIAGDDGRVHAVHADSGALGEPLRGHSAAVLALDVSVDGRRIATAGRDGVVCVWRAGELVEQIRTGHPDILRVRMDPGGKGVVTAHADGEVRWSEAAVGTTRLVVRTAPGANDVAWLATGDLAVGPTADIQRRGYWSAAWEPDRRTRIVTLPDGSTVRWWGEAVQLLAGGSAGVALLPDQGPYLCDPIHGTLTRPLDGADWRRVGGEGYPRWMVGGTHLVSQMLRRTLVWDVDTPTEENPVDGEALAPIASVYGFHPLVLSRAGRWLLGVNGEEAVAVVDADTGLEQASLGSLEISSFRDWRSAAIASDQNRVLVAWIDRSGTARVFDGLTGSVLHEVDHDAPASRVAFSGDASLVAFALEDGRILLLDTSSFEVLHRLGGSRGAERWLAFVAGRDASAPTLFGLGADRILRWWNPREGREIGDLDLHGSIPLGPVGDAYLVTLSADRTLVTFQALDVVAAAAARQPRRLTSSELEQYLGGSDYSPLATRDSKNR